MKKVHIVPHMHWDREWYFSAEESRILLVNNMSEIMEMLENNPDYPYYVLDGQTAILEDYLSVCLEEKPRLAKLVAEGRLVIGPWYTQTDELVVGAESIVRNLLYGLKDVRAFGEPMKIGYLPDSFGQSAQMPQILNGFDIHHAIFWRGVSERHGTNQTEFYWKSDDESKVLVQLMPLGYAIGKYLPVDGKALKARMDKYFQVLDKGATTAHQLIPNGHDQMPIQQNIFEVIDQLHQLYPNREFFLSRYENLFRELDKKTDLDTLQSEFIDGKYARVHRSIFSTRMDIKAANARIESKLTNILEPLATIAHELGFTYHHGLIEAIWKTIMKNHAHDSIGCCCSDLVHREIMERFVNAEERTDQLIDFYKRKIVDAICADDDVDRLTLFNLVPYEREEVVTTTVISKLAAFELIDGQNRCVPFEILHQEVIDPGLIDRQIVHYGNYEPFIAYQIQFTHELPAMGYDTLYIQEADRVPMQDAVEVAAIETDFYEIKANSNGTVTIVDKASNTTYENVFNLEDVADDGDEYDFSPLPDGKVIYSKDHVRDATAWCTQHAHMGSMQIHYQLAVPTDLEARKNGVCDGAIEIAIEMRVAKKDRTIGLKVTLDNGAKDHRTRLLVPTGISAAFSIADNQFGVVERPVYDQAMAVWESEDWDERPDGIYPFLSHVSLTSDTQTVSVLSNSTREYEIIGVNDDTIAITLLRSVGVLGKENLSRRPGRPSGIKLPTPDSQMLGKIMLDLALVFSNVAFADAHVGRLAKAFLTPVLTYNKIPYNAMKLNDSMIVTPQHFSLMSYDQVDVVLSALKVAEDGAGLIVRLFNPSLEKRRLAVNWRLVGTEVKMKRANLNEQLLGEFDGEIVPNQAVTLKILK